MDILSGVNYTVARDGQTFGPYEGSQLIPMVQQGQIVATDQVWTDGMAAWLPATSFNQLAPFFQPQQPQAQPQQQAQASPTMILQSQPMQTSAPGGAAPAKKSSAKRPANIQSRRLAASANAAAGGGGAVQQQSAPSRASNASSFGPKPGAKFGMLLTFYLVGIIAYIAIIPAMLPMMIDPSAEPSGSMGMLTLGLYGLAMVLFLLYGIFQLIYTYRIWNYLQPLPMVKRSPSAAVWLPFIPFVGFILMILIRLDLVKEFQRYLTASGQDNPGAPRPTAAMQILAMFIPFINIAADKQLCDSINFIACAEEVDLSNAPPPA